MDISTQNLMVNGEFLVGYGGLNWDTYLSVDYYDNGRSWERSNYDGSWYNGSTTFLIRAVVQYTDGRIAEISPSISKPVINNQRSGKSGNDKKIEVEEHIVSSSTRDFLGYNMYLNGVMVAENVATESYQYTDLVDGTHTGGVTANYDEGESAMIMAEFTYSSPILPPANLVGEIQNYNDVMLTWEEPANRGGKIPAMKIEKLSSIKNEAQKTSINVNMNDNEDDTRILEGYNIYRDDEEIGYVDVGVLEYLDAGLNAGEYTYYVTGVYDNGESDPSNVIDIAIVLPAPVNFNAISQDGNVMCTWSVPTEIRDLTGYKIYRDDVEIGTSTETFYIDTGVGTGTYVYYATAMYSDMYESEASNQVELDHVDASDNLIPLVTELTGNFPNPFNPVTNIKLALSQNDHVRIDIYNLKGEKITTLIDEELEAAYYTLTWNGTDDHNNKVTSGVYFYKMKAGKYTSTRKMIMLK